MGFCNDSTGFLKILENLHIRKFFVGLNSNLIDGGQISEFLFFPDNLISLIVCYCFKSLKVLRMGKKIPIFPTLSDVRRDMSLVAFEAFWELKAL